MNINYHIEYLLKMYIFLKINYRIIIKTDTYNRCNLIGYYTQPMIMEFCVYVCMCVFILFYQRFFKNAKSHNLLKCQIIYWNTIKHV